MWHLEIEGVTVGILYVSLIDTSYHDVEISARYKYEDRSWVERDCDRGMQCMTHVEPARHTFYIRSILQTRGRLSSTHTVCVCVVWYSPGIRCRTTTLLGKSSFFPVSNNLYYKSNWLAINSDAVPHMLRLVRPTLVCCFTVVTNNKRQLGVIHQSLY